MKHRNVRFCGAGALLRKRRHAETSCSKTLHQAVRHKCAPPASRFARVRRRAPLLGGWLACSFAEKRRIGDSRCYRKCAPPAHPMAAPARAFTLAGTALLSDICFHPSFCQGVAPKNFACGVLYPHTPLRGYYTLALPCYLFIAHSNARFVKESRRKIFWAMHNKFFAPLTTTASYNS